MIDRVFTAVLTFCLLAAATLAIVSAVFENPPAKVAAPVVQLPAVEMRVQQLPRVEVTGKRVAAGTTVARSHNTEPATQNLQ